jgi:hypothetical protein
VEVGFGVYWGGLIVLVDIGGYWWILIWTKSLRYYYDVPQDNSGEQQGALVYNARSQAWMLLLQIQRG